MELIRYNEHTLTKWCLFDYLTLGSGAKLHVGWNKYVMTGSGLYNCHIDGLIYENLGSGTGWHNCYLAGLDKFLNESRLIKSFLLCFLRDK